MLGCSRGPQYTLVPVQGSIKIDGAPAANILVQFMPDASRGTAGPSSTGTTDSQGRFELTTVDQRPGASVGSHVVVLIDLDEDRPEQGEESTKPARLSSAYATEKGGVKVSVAEGQSIDLDIPSESPLDQPNAATSTPSGIPGQAEAPDDSVEIPAEIERERK